MNPFEKLDQLIKTCVKETFIDKLEIKDFNYRAIVLENTRDKKNGELSTNAAMILASKVKKSPREIAASLKAELEKIDFVSKIEVASAGFINFTLTKESWQSELLKIAEQKNKYGSSNLGGGEKVNLEFASPNPTGPMHVGHTRGAIFGDALASTLKFAGFDVTREFYVNDAGNQINILAQSVYFRYLQLFGLKKSEELPSNCYPGDYIIDVAEKLKEKFSDKFVDAEKSQWLEQIKEFAVGEMLKLICADLKKAVSLGDDNWMVLEALEKHCKE